jgi:hypothetical protein
MTMFWDALKALRDGALAKRAAAKQADDVTPVIVKGNNNIIPLRLDASHSASNQRRAVASPLPARRSFSLFEPEPEPPVSMPLLYTAALHTAHSIASEFDGDPRFADEATSTWRADQQKTTWRDSNRDLPRRDNR